MDFGNINGQGIAEIRNFNFQNLSSAPTTNVTEGRFYYNTTDHTLYVYNGTSWVNALTQGKTYLAGLGIDITSATISVKLNNSGNVTLSTSASGLSASVAEASTSAKGIIEIATDTEANTGTSETLAVNPKQLATKVDKLSTKPTAGTYTKVTINGEGQVTGGANLQASDIPNLTLSKITDVTSTANEVNQLHDAGAVKADFEKLHDLTATATELNYTDGVTSNIQTQLDSKLAKKPDGTNDLIDGSDKVNMVYLPDVVLGQMLYAGTFIPSTAVATLTTNAKTILGTTSDTITLTNDTTAITGYKANEGNFYIAAADGTFASLSFQTGDWLLSTGDGWARIANTDAVTGVKGNAESTYRIGNVNITADNVLPTQTSNSGKFLTTDGTNCSWGTVDAFPSQSGNSGKFLTTNGSTTSWANAVTPDGTQTLTNKTIDADNNTISDLTVSNLKSGVLQTTIRDVSSASDTSIASEKAIATGLAGKSTVTFVDWS